MTVALHGRKLKTKKNAYTGTRQNGDHQWLRTDESWDGKMFPITWSSKKVFHTAAPWFQKVKASKPPASAAAQAMLGG